MKDHRNEAALYVKALSGTVQWRRVEAKREQDEVEGHSSGYKFDLIPPPTPS